MEKIFLLCFNLPSLLRSPILPPTLFCDVFKMYRVEVRPSVVLWVVIGNCVVCFRVCFPAIFVVEGSILVVVTYIGSIGFLTPYAWDKKESLMNYLNTLFHQNGSLTIDLKSRKNT